MASAISGTVCGPVGEGGEDPRSHDRLLPDDLSRVPIGGGHQTGTSTRLSIIEVTWASV